MSNKSALALSTYTRPLVREASAILPQWLFPGPNSRHVRAYSSVAVPDYSGGAATAALLPAFQIPDGMVFSLRGVQLQVFAQSFNQASGDLLATLAVTAGGNRNVDYLVNIATELGSNELPYPIGGRLEFEPLDMLQWSVTVSANVGIGAPNFVAATLWGHIYPAGERVDGD